MLIGALVLPAVDRRAHPRPVARAGAWRPRCPRGRRARLSADRAARGPARLPGRSRDLAQGRRPAPALGRRACPARREAGRLRAGRDRPATRRRRRRSRGGVAPGVGRHVEARANGSPPSAAAARARWCPIGCSSCAAQDLDILIYPMDLLISGKPELLARARAAMASRLTTTAAHLTVSAESQADRGPPDGAGDRHRRRPPERPQVRRRGGRRLRGDRRVARHARRPIRRMGGPVPPAAPGRARPAGGGDGRRGDHRDGDARRRGDPDRRLRRPSATAPTSSSTRRPTSARRRHSTGWRGRRSASGSSSRRRRSAP